MCCISGEGAIAETISALGPWFHNLHLPDGTQTAADHPLGDFPSYKWDQIAPHLPEDLSGWSALDIGCNAGFYSFELARRGAQVIGIDLDARYLAQAKWAADQFGLTDQVDFQQLQVYDLAHIDQAFDLVLFMGVFYHLRYPLLGMDIVTSKVRRLMVFQTLMIPGEQVTENVYDSNLNDRQALSDLNWPKMAFIEHRFSGDPTNWWIPNRAGIEAMLRSSGMRLISRPEPETYLCEPDESHPASVRTWNTAEILSATGRRWLY